MTEAVLEQWLAAEQQILAMHAQGPGPGVADLRAIAQQHGMDTMRAVLNGSAPTPTVGHAMNFLLVEVASGHAVFQGTPGPNFLNPMGTVHGGWYATLLDSAMGCAVHTRMPAGRAYTTAELSINIVKALSPKVRRVRAIGQVLHCGRQLATAEAKLVGPDGTLYAHGTSTCLVFDWPTQGEAGGQMRASSV